MRRTASFPRRISVEPTNHCNQRCVLCPRQGFTRPLGFMELSLFERIAAECARHETRLWLHFLGEPLLHPGLLSMVRAAKAAGVAEVGLSTNGVSLRGALADGLIEAGLDRLECSMDALDREGYRSLRGRDHYARVLRNVEDFLARKAALGSERPVTSIQFMHTPDFDARVSEAVERWRPQLAPRDFVMGIEPASFGGAIAAGVAESSASPPRRPCAWLFESLVVMQDGTVTMCGADWDARHALGHLRQASLEEIWNGAELRRRRRAHLDGRFREVAPCADCQDWRLAEGSGYRNLLDAEPVAAAGAAS